MALDQQVLQVLKDINISIGSIYDLMQRQEDRGRSQTNMPAGQPTSREGQRRQLTAADWASPQLRGQGQGTAGMWPGMMGMGGMGMAGMWPGMMGMGGMMGRMHLPFGMAHAGGTGTGSQGDTSVFQRLVEVLGKLNQRLTHQGVGGPGTGGGGPGTTDGGRQQTTSPRRQTPEEEYQFHRRQALLDRHFQKHAADRSWEDLGPWGRAMNRTGRGWRVLGSAAGAVEGMADASLAKDGNMTGTVAAGGQSLAQAGAQVGGKVGVAMSVIGKLLEIPAKVLRFAENTHQANMALAGSSPGMARVQAFAEVQQMMHERRMGEERSESAMRLAQERAANRAAWEPITNKVANIRSDAMAGTNRIGRWFAGKVADADEIAASASKDEKGFLTKEEREQMRTGIARRPGSMPFSDLAGDLAMHSPWFVDMNRPPHMK